MAQLKCSNECLLENFCLNLFYDDKMEKLENPFAGKRALSGLATTRHCLTDERKGMEMLRWKIKENGKIKMEAIKDAEMEKGDEHKDRNGSEKS